MTILFTRQVMLHIPAKALKPRAQRAVNIASVGGEQVMGNAVPAQHRGIRIDNDAFIASAVVTGKF
ncbi:hypothetical protein AMC94_14435 [Pseudomonas amygdali pv. aesculi]|nr:hypothetical protein PSYAE_10856 [Pseudomonas amygdali pv. aesculi str. 0893_23]KWS30302.1 hypothetical protein AL065_17855 [Pseudomonas amygdali pv. ulmi]KWT02178.1 hypothetical protein AL041_07485 [Pseudomonas amygdali pv. aesculi]KWT18798.1 hypothetical protein AL042_28660 [Pseudomonas amygdali pv. aesculi]KWT26003.1 hypothetical protein AL043_17990 [Pseudomonas amygdali pv. aesculi]